MNPAPSVLLFTVLSGLGFGFLAALGLGRSRLSLGLQRGQYDLRRLVRLRGTGRTAQQQQQQ